MLPIETAIACACALNRLWRDTFQAHFVSQDDPCPSPTLSGSIIFADYQNALSDVRRLTHERLDKVAKERMGRNALALAVMKSGGIVSQWASCWHGPALNGAQGADDDRDMAQGLFDYAKKAAKDNSTASRLPYLVRTRYQRVMDEQTKDEQDMFNDAQLVDFLAKEFSGNTLSERQEQAAEVVSILRPYCRKHGSDDRLPAPRHVGGLLIARFLAQNCMWSYVRDRDKPAETGDAT